MGTREAVLSVGRPALLRPFTSATTGERSSNAPEFSYRIPWTSETEFIQLLECRWPSVRFVYIFLDAGRLSPEDTFTGLVERYLVGDSEGNPLLTVMRVDPRGEQASVSGRDYKDALDSGLEPSFVDVGAFEQTSVEPEQLGEELSGCYAVAAPLLIPLDAVRALERRRPAGVPVLGTGMGLGVEGEVGAQTPGGARWVFPIVDPLLIADNLARKYSEACDNFLAASQQFERPPPRNQDERAARERGQVQRLKKVVADNLIALKKAAPKLESVFADNLDPGFPEAFVEEYDDFLKELAFERERAAYDLIAWLESEVFALADDYWPRNESKPTDGYELYVRSVTGGLARLIESTRGVTYLADLQRRREESMSPVPSGVVHVVSEYVLRDAESSDEQGAVAAKTSTQVFGAWTAFLAASLAVKQRVVRGRNPNTSLGEDLERFVKRLSFVFQGGFLKIRLDSVPVELTIPRSVKTTVVSIPTRSLILPAGARAALQRAKLGADHVSRVCAIVNFGLAYAALRNALDEQGDERAKYMAMSDLAGASLGVVDGAMALPVVESFRDRFSGKINMGGALLGNRAAGCLGLLGAIASLTSASLAASQEMDKGDWDKAMAHMTEGFGAMLVGTGTTVILVSGTTGPFALWTIGLGTAISAGGFIWSVFAADTELDTMLKFCAFGLQKGQAAVAPGWALCDGSFAEWNPETVEGLTRQLEAFQQVFYSFEASGAPSTEPGPLASDGILRLIPSSLRAKSSFQVRYEAVYVTTNGASRTAPRELKGVAVLQIGANGARLVDHGKNYVEGNAVKIHDADGRDVLDVRLRLREPLRDDQHSFMELDSLTCFVQLRVEGAAADEGSNSVLIVPRTRRGANELALVAFKRPTFRAAPVSSLKGRSLE